MQIQIAQTFQSEIQQTNDAIQLYSDPLSNGRWLVGQTAFMDRLCSELIRIQSKLNSERSILEEYRSNVLSTIRQQNQILLEQVALLPPAPEPQDLEDEMIEEISLEEMNIHGETPPEDEIETENKENTEMQTRNSASHKSQALHENSKPSNRQLDPLTLDEISAVPKYICNRLTLDKVNESAKQFNLALIEKYRNMRIPQQKMNKEMRQRYWLYKESENHDTKNKSFLTEQDLKSSKSSKFRMDPTGRSVIAILRHCGRIKESRGGGYLRLIVIPEKNQSVLTIQV